LVHIACITETSKSSTLQYHRHSVFRMKVSLASRPMMTRLELRCGTRTVKAHHFGPGECRSGCSVDHHRLLEYASFNVIVMFHVTCYNNFRIKRYQNTVMKVATCRRSMKPPSCMRNTSPVSTFFIIHGPLSNRRSGLYCVFSFYNNLMRWQIL
jgi:hypothetical protein